MIIKKKAYVTSFNMENFPTRSFSLNAVSSCSNGGDNDVFKVFITEEDYNSLIQKSKSLSLRKPINITLEIDEEVTNGD